MLKIREEEEKVAKELKEKERLVSILIGYGYRPPTRLAWSPHGLPPPTGGGGVCQTRLTITTRCPLLPYAGCAGFAHTLTAPPASPQAWPAHLETLKMRGHC